MVFFIIKDRKTQRAQHWNDIRSRVRTHEGELLTGDAGKRYSEKYSEKYLGKDISNVKPITDSDVERFEKTGT